MSKIESGKLFYFSILTDQKQFFPDQLRRLPGWEIKTVRSNQ